MADTLVEDKHPHKHLNKHVRDGLIRPSTPQKVMAHELKTSQFQDTLGKWSGYQNW